MTDEELKEIVASIAVEHRELVVAQKETDRQLKAQAVEAEHDRREMKKSNRELGKKIGGLANKFGSFTEGLALPSMQQILRSQFNMEVVSPSVRVKKGDEELEIDVLSYANGTLNEVYVVEVKSHLRDEGVDQLFDIVSRFRHFFPEHKDKKLYGIMAAVEMSNRLKERVLSKGFYAAKISDEVFSIDVPAQFQPKAY